MSGEHGGSQPAPRARSRTVATGADRSERKGLTSCKRRVLAQLIEGDRRRWAVLEVAMAAATKGLRPDIVARLIDEVASGDGGTS